MQGKGAFTVAPLERVPHGIQHRTLQPCIQAFNAQRMLGEIIHMPENHPTQGIRDRQEVS